MKKSITIAKRVLFSNIPMLVIIIGMALLFNLFFGKIFGGMINPSTLPMALVVEDGSELARDFRDALLANPRLRVTETSEKEARKRVDDSKAVLALILREGFSREILQKKAPELLIVREGESNSLMAVRQEIEKEFTRIRIAATAAFHLAGSAQNEKWWEIYREALVELENPGVSVASTELGKKPDSSENMMDRIGIGLAVMFMMITVIAASGAILDEKNRGTWQRILTSPVSKTGVLGGYLLSYYSVGCLQFLILYFASRLIFGVNWGPPPGVIVIVATFLFCSISLGLTIAGFARTYQQQQAVSTLVVTASSMLGGLFWPLEMVAPAMKTVAKVTPQYWAMAAFDVLAAKGLDWQALSGPLLVLLAIAVVLFGLGISRIKFE